MLPVRALGTHFPLGIRLHTSQSRAATGRLWTAVVLFVAALVAGAVARWTALSFRPMHTDEAVQAQVFLAPMLEGQPYHYDSVDGHGPLLVYSTRVLCALTGTHTYAELSERLLRMTPALYSLGILLALLLIADGLGRMAVSCAALFTALSPMMVYYGRYYIMETPLVLFSLLAIAGVWRYAVSRQPAWLALAGAAIGLMHATKETFLIPLIAGTLAMLAVQALEYFFAGAGISIGNRKHRVGQFTTHDPSGARGVDCGPCFFRALLRVFSAVRDNSSIPSRAT